MAPNWVIFASVAVFLLVVLGAVALLIWAAPRLRRDWQREVDSRVSEWAQDEGVEVLSCSPSLFGGFPFFSFGKALFLKIEVRDRTGRIRKGRKRPGCS